MTDPVPNMEPPTPVSVCGICGATSRTTDDWTECEDCRRLVCERCAQGEYNRYKADLCPSCAEAREPRDGEQFEAFDHARQALDEFVRDSDYEPSCDCPTATSYLLAAIEALQARDCLSFRAERNIRDAIRKMPLDERPWRKKEGAGT